MIFCIGNCPHICYDSFITWDASALCSHVRPLFLAFFPAEKTKPRGHVFFCGSSVFIGSTVAFIEAVRFVRSSTSVWEV